MGLGAAMSNVQAISIAVPKSTGHSALLCSCAAVTATVTAATTAWAAVRSSVHNHIQMTAATDA
jgi:hypothetical protein